jgi:hypothetical protein
VNPPVGSFDALYLNLGSINDFVGHKTSTQIQVKSGGCKPSFLAV